MKSPVSSICRVAWAKRASSRSTGGIEASPGAYRVRQRSSSNAKPRTLFNQLPFLCSLTKTGSGWTRNSGSKEAGAKRAAFGISPGLRYRQLSNRSQRPPEVVSADRVGAADGDARQGAAVIRLPVEEPRLALDRDDIGDKTPSGPQSCPQRGQQTGV